MNLFLIKIGKAVHVLKREGFVRGGKRVALAFLALFRRVKPGDILFITGGVGDSARYRTAHVAEELTSHGLACAVTVQDNPFLVSYADRFSVFVFHRVLHTEKVARLIERIKSSGKEIIFETDDLVYDPQWLSSMDGYDRMNAFEKKLYATGLGKEIVNDPYVKTCTTTTTFLADKLREKGKHVFVVRNKLSQHDIASAEEILRTAEKESPLVRIAYLSGTPSHNKDFATITDALFTLFGKYPQMRLVLAGPLDTEDKLKPFQNRIERVPFLPRKEYFATVASMDINVAPLEIGNPFCEAKSELKWFEAGLVAVPTVASATGTFQEAIRDGIDGYVAATTEEWIAKLSGLIEDGTLRGKIGAKAREKILRHYAAGKADNQEYYDYLRRRISERENVTI
ncbi:MAG: glycosyltransferase [Candidatus Moraniibacteriota bacterium]